MCNDLAEISAGADFNIKHICDYEMTVHLFPSGNVDVTSKQMHTSSLCSYVVPWDEKMRGNYIPLPTSCVPVQILQPVFKKKTNYLFAHLWTH